uniref:CCHC-type domain-containing protein n=1 Tax=Panagrolaimus sp. ES5 TaxID=591445 RepID=A0AC34GHI0_9BILA
LCFVCGKSSHIAKDCPLRFVEKAIDNVKNFTVGGINHVKTVSHDPVKLFGDKTLLEAQFDGFKVNATLDSGSCVSVIDDKVLKGILRNKSRHGKITRERPETYKDMIGLVGVNGMKLKVIDCVRIPIAWDKYEPSH